MRSQFAFEYLPVESLELDRENPRIRRFLDQYEGDITAEQIALALGCGDTATVEGHTTFQSLKESIRANGSIIQPIIVNRKEDGCMVVVDGNTRLQIYRDFQAQGVRGDWSSIPTMVFYDLAKDSIDAIRFTGSPSWTSSVGPIFEGALPRHVV